MGLWIPSNDEADKLAKAGIMEELIWSDCYSFHQRWEGVFGERILG